MLTKSQLIYKKKLYVHIEKPMHYSSFYGNMNFFRI